MNQTRNQINELKTLREAYSNINESNKTKANQYQIKFNGGLIVAIPSGKDLDVIKAELKDAGEIQKYDTKKFELANALGLHS